MLPPCEGIHFNGMASKLTCYSYCVKSAGIWHLSINFHSFVIINILQLPKVHLLVLPFVYG